MKEVTKEEFYDFIMKSKEDIISNCYGRSTDPNGYCSDFKVRYSNKLVGKTTNGCQEPFKKQRYFLQEE